VDQVVPFRQFVLKVHSRCDLACDHCYVYRAADQSWRDQPVVMSAKTTTWAARRIAEHASEHELRQVYVVLHGGEPLLAGPPRLGEIADTRREHLDGICEMDLRIHTNGVLLDEDFCDVFDAHGIRVGISIDGDRAANDRHRRYANGRSSYDRVVRATDLLRGDRYRHLYLGLLCTIDLANDPVAVYEALLTHEPPRIDFLAPHATWDNPPQRPPEAPAAYADWLIAIFDRWNRSGQPVDIRLFDSVIRTTRGQRSRTEAIGLAPSDLVVIETSGGYEQADSLKATYDGAPATGYNVFRHTLNQVGEHPGIRARQAGLDGLSDQCRRCEIVASCGGGLYAHRYRSGTGFANPSVYCPDLMKLIKHIGGQARPTAAAARGQSGRVHSLTAADVTELAAGYGGPDAIGRLARAQRSLRRALLAEVHQRATADAEFGRTTRERLTSAWDLLVRVEQRAPEALETVISHPYVRAWATRCLDRHTGPAKADLEYLAAIAAAAAIRAGIDAHTEITTRHGSLHLPTLGQLVLPGADGRTVCTIIASSAGTVTFSARSGWRAEARVSPTDLCFRPVSRGFWQASRHLDGPGISVVLEDGDPYRDCHQWPTAPRCSQAQLELWQRTFDAAWSLIATRFRAYHEGLIAGLSAIVPLAPRPNGREISSASRQAFGAVAAALPADPAVLALLMLHEFQHVKLGAVMDMYDLFDRADPRLFRAPWRDDPRPLEGLFQGTYAHVAVVEFWRARYQAGGPDAAAAGRQFAHWRAATAQAIETLLGSGSLTPMGQRFADGMRATVMPWLDEHVPRR
jgi:uncharacterized protein